MGRAPKLDDEAILDRAMLAFWRNGWTSTSIRDLERAVGMKAPSLYRRFGNKEGLGVAVVDHYVERIVRRRVERLLPGTGDSLENVTEFLTRSVTESADGPGLWGCLLTTTAVEADRLDEPLTAALARGRAVIESALAHEVGRAGELGELRAGVEPAAATSMLMLVLQGLMAMARTGTSASGLQQRARDSVSVLAARSASDGSRSP